MLAKLRLDQTGTFEKLVGAHEISKMLVSFIEGKVHPLEIGAEQGGIEKWDDFVIQQDLKRRTHIQIKRQTDSFGSHLDECERNTVNRNIGTEKSLQGNPKANASIGVNLSITVLTSLHITVSSEFGQILRR